MAQIPRPLRSIFRPLKPRSSAIEQGLALTSILAAMVLAAMALVVHRINSDATEAGKRSVRAIDTMATLDRLQLSLRDGDMAGRDLAGARHERADVERYDNARFQARLHLTALGPLAGDDPAQSERLSRLTPLIDRQFGLGARSYEATAPVTRDEVDGLIATLRQEESRRLQGFRTQQSQANERSTWIMIGALALVSLLSLVFWVLLKVEFRARRVLESRLIESATTDELTGVSNRSDFDRKLVQEWAFRQRYGTALSLLVIDIDHLKQHNEQWGHVAGDSVLREVARRLALRVKRSELLARIGAGQFAMLVPLHRKEALTLGEQLRQQIADAPCLLLGRDKPEPLKVTVSIGVSEASDVETPRELLGAADGAVGIAQRQGRNRVETFVHDTTIAGRVVLGSTTATAVRRERAPVTIV